MKRPRWRDNDEHHWTLKTTQGIIGFLGKERWRPDVVFILNFNLKKWPTHLEHLEAKLFHMIGSIAHGLVVMYDYDD